MNVPRKPAYTLRARGRRKRLPKRGFVMDFAAVLASFGILYAVCLGAHVNPSPAILSAALCMGLVRRPETASGRKLALKLVTLPFIALAASLVGYAFLRMPVLGATLFTCGIALSVALRQFGERAALIGRTLALPFIAMLVVPVRVDPGANVLAIAVLTLLAGAVAMLCAAAASYALPKAEPAPRKMRAVEPGWNSVPTRMALQMFAALVLAFAIGFTAFPAHWFWVVLSAFIVCSGAVGRGDAMYKALLRLGGAIGGTLLAALVANARLPSSTAYAALIFAVLFAGMRLRRINYAYWAACATLIFALLQGSGGRNVLPLFAARVLCIFIGALCGVAAAWFVYPIRTRQVVRRRVADALAAMREVLTGGAADLEHHAGELQRVAPPVRLHRMIFGAGDPDEHPATWIDRAHALLMKMRESSFDRKNAGAELRAIGSMLKSSDESKPRR